LAVQGIAAAIADDAAVLARARPTLGRGTCAGIRLAQALVTAPIGRAVAALQFAAAAVADGAAVLAAFDRTTGQAAGIAIHGAIANIVRTGFAIGTVTAFQLAAAAIADRRAVRSTLARTCGLGEWLARAGVFRGGAGVGQDEHGGTVRVSWRGLSATTSRSRRPSLRADAHIPAALTRRKRGKKDPCHQCRPNECPRTEHGKPLLLGLATLGCVSMAVRTALEADAARWAGSSTR